MINPTKGFDVDDLPLPPTEQLFDQAQRFVRAAATSGKGWSPDQASQLALYAAFKQAVEGPCLSKCPSLFDMRGRAKWKAWKALGDMSTSEAQRLYLSTLRECFPDWDAKDKVGRRGEGEGFGVMQSRLARELIDEEHKSVFDLVCEGDVESVLRKIDEGHVDVNCTDVEDGRTMLHYAVDCGHLEMARCLLQADALVNFQDNEGQTPLHLALICALADVVELLVDAGASLDIIDVEGHTPKDMAEYWDESVTDSQRSRLRRCVALADDSRVKIFIDLVNC